ncbi:Chloroperoxidase [Paraphoma chrysanthemicola]|uniref:Chloroperoxidase n=1 Tax=Paraphoma chrysanthemicola TaxID=798071 RepID=A0A8K0R828_9PLEO|nr:Chloroperoxidase [Paraphoma chrysanthemicola]
MLSEQDPLLANNVPIGTYHPATPTDKRSPCPMINTLANHGYLPRTGTSITASQMKLALRETGISTSLGAIFVNTVYNIHTDSTTPLPSANVFTRIWTVLCHPYTLLARFGMRRPGQVDISGQAVLDLDQLALPGAVEHDISLTRRDHAEKQGNCTKQDDLIDTVIASSTDGKVITREDFAALRRRRIAVQKAENQGCVYGGLQHEMACGEIALILGVFGDGNVVKREYVEVFLKEERLPSEEGWVKRWWWTLGLVEVKWIGSRVKKMIGLQI